jgi:hypothetical protein
VTHHPVLGDSRPLGREVPCSCCGEAIADDQVPLICWSKNGEEAWVYCARCEREVLPMFIPARGSL